MSTVLLFPKNSNVLGNFASMYAIMKNSIVPINCDNVVASIGRFNPLAANAPNRYPAIVMLMNFTIVLMFPISLSIVDPYSPIRFFFKKKDHELAEGSWSKFFFSDVKRGDIITLF